MKVDFREILNHETDYLKSLKKRKSLRMHTLDSSYSDQKNIVSSPENNSRKLPIKR
jgi:hypothetical protein